MDHAIEEIHTNEPDRWREALSQAGAYDFYHSCAYHELAEQNGEGEARLLVWRRDGNVIALPLLLRCVDRIPTLQTLGSGLYDAVSVYGYSGPVGEEPADGARSLFQSDLAAWLRARRVISLFFRLHPLLDRARMIEGLGENVTVGPTVAIDLGQPPEEQIAHYRSNHRRDLRKLRQQGFACEVTSDPAAIARFAEIYRETMQRVDAAPSYLFDDRYFARLIDIPSLDLMQCSQEGEMCAGAIISRCGGIAQYHLGGTSADWLARAPMKLIFDETRQLAYDTGCKWLHLGGGLGAREDALFNFKAGFSSTRLAFKVWRWVIDEHAYDALTERSGATGHSQFFPAYAG